MRQQRYSRRLGGAVRGLAMLLVAVGPLTAACSLEPDPPPADRPTPRQLVESLARASKRPAEPDAPAAPAPLAQAPAGAPGAVGALPVAVASVAGTRQAAGSDASPRIARGVQSLVLTDASTIGGGVRNVAGAHAATVGGGAGNAASHEFSTVAGGSANSATSEAATVSGGSRNAAIADNATVGGGLANRASGHNTTVGGGSLNMVSGNTASVAGGNLNSASGSFATIGGGSFNSARGRYATVPGGRSGHAMDDGTFVWNDSTLVSGTSPFASNSTLGAQPGHFHIEPTNSFHVRATGGARFVTDDRASAGAYLAPGGAAWTAGSHSSLKEHFTSVDGRTVLEQLAALAITTWNLKSQDPSVRHLGPMAEEFYVAFGLGDTEQGILSTDADGVAFAAIQGLYALVQEQQAENASLAAQLNAQAAELAALRQSIVALLARD